MRPPGKQVVVPNRSCLEGGLDLAEVAVGRESLLEAQPHLGREDYEEHVPTPSRDIFEVIDSNTCDDSVDKRVRSVPKCPLPRHSCGTCRRWTYWT